MSLLLMATGMSAVPAKPGIWKTVKLANGTEVRVELQGDEHASFWRSADGICYVQDGDKATYKTISIDKIKERAAESRSLKEKARRAEKKGIGAKKVDYKGEKRGLVILVEFQDMPFRTENTRDLFDDICNKENYTSDRGFVGSVRDYFKAQSEGQLDLTFDVVGPVKVSQDYAYYGANNSYGNDMRPEVMVEEACLLVDSQVDFSKYNWDGDQFVDQVVIIYAGKGEAAGGDPNTIWPHESFLISHGKYLNLDGLYINKYSCSAELNNQDDISGIGTFCHEFSHCLGLPDLYDTDYSGGYGMKSWGIMDQGNYNGNGFIPANYTAYEKAQCGWKKLVELKDNAEITTKTLGEGGDAYVIYNGKSRDEFYMLENRQQTGWDSEIAGSGLLITHIDYSSTAWNKNTVNDDPNHQRMTVVPADNSFATNNIGGDIWPYQGTNALTNDTKPAATLYSANADGALFLNKMITNIKNNGDGTVSFRFINGKNNVQLPEGAIFWESFDLCGGIGANDSKWTGSGIGVASFVPDNEGWVSSKAYAADQCATFGSNTQKGIVTTPEIEINGEATLTFKAAPLGSAAVSLSISDANGGATIDSPSFTLTPGTWTECSTLIKGTGSIAIKFNGKRFFLDSVKVTNGNTSGIEGADASVENGDARIFGLDGRYLGTDWSTLGHGVYIMGGKKIVK